MRHLPLILAIVLLLCLLPMPYGYYMFVRVVAAVSFAYFAYQFHSTKSEVMMLLFIALALLFQPIVKIPLGRELWNAVDVIVAVGMLVMYWRNIRSNKL